ncbi:MAG: DeoR/GlpR family DNA-binding transcription regulator [Spirochaetota bacterium]
MTNIERRRYITQKLRESGTLRVDQLSDELQVTTVTIRSDVAELERRGLAVRSRGVILAPEGHELPRNVSNTIKENLAEKEAIAKTARTLLEPGQTVIIDGGSTNAVFARALHDIQLTVVTNSVPVILELVPETDIDIIVSGGILRKPSMSLVGEFSRSLYEHIRADIAFVGAAAVSVEHGPSGPNLLEAETKRSVIASANSVCLLVDSAKFGQTKLAHICSWDKITYLVTDRISDGDRASLTEAGVIVLTPGDNG